MVYKDKLIAFRFKIKIQGSIITSFSEDCHVQNNVHGFAITRSNELRYLKGVAKQVYTRGSLSGEKVFESKNSKLILSNKNKTKICNLNVTICNCVD